MTAATFCSVVYSDIQFEQSSGCSTGCWCVVHIDSSDVLLGSGCRLVLGLSTTVVCFCFSVDDRRMQ